MLTPILQKRPNFRIPYFRPCKCRPLHSANHGSMPPPLPANTADATKAAIEILFVSIISRAILKQISSAAPLFRNLRWPIPRGSDFSMHVKNDHQSILKLCKIWCFRETVNDFLTYRQICGQRLIEIASCFVAPPVCTL